MLVFYLQMIESEENKLKFRKIYDQYNSLLFYIAGKFFEEKRDAEDAVQDAYLAIIENLDNVGDEDSNKTRHYVITITENKCLDRLRKNRNILQTDWDDATPGLEFEIPEETGLQAALAKLPPRYRELLILKYDCGYSVKEIADNLSSTPKAVESALRRAKLALQAILDKEGMQE